MLVVLALGGNALLRRHQAPELALQRRNILDAVASSVAPIARRHRLLVTHGNGPQIGLLALQAAALQDVPPYPLDVLGAESEGMIGYMIQLALAEHLPKRDIATLLTQVEVEAEDPAFDMPSKPIGPLYDRPDMLELAARHAWKFARDGEYWRRVVASPRPRRIRELNVLRLLLDANVVVICAGGGGIPVVADAAGGLRGVEAVIDKDLSAALVAESLGADALLLLTDVDCVWTSWPPNGAARRIGETTPAELRSLTFAGGSMAPKVEAACRFVERTGRFAAIGALHEAQAILDRKAGTLVSRNS